MKKCLCVLENCHSQKIKTLEKTVLSHHQGMHANYKSFTYSHIPALRLVWHVRNIMSEIFDEDSKQYCKNVFRSFKSNCNLCTLNKKMLSFFLFLFFLLFYFLVVLILRMSKTNIIYQCKTLAHNFLQTVCLKTF